MTGQGRGRLPRADLPGQAGADLVGGPAVRRRRRRRRPDLRLQLQADRQVRAGNGYSFDLHEFTITPRNTALVLAYERYKRDLTAVGRAEGRDGSSTTSSRRSTSRPASCCSSGTASATSRPTSPTSRCPKDERARVGVLPRQRGRRSTATATSSSPARNTLDDLQDQPRDRQDHVAPRRQEAPTSSSARACGSTGSTASARQPDGTLTLFDNYAAPPVAQELARAHAQARREGQDGDARERVQAPGASCSRASQGNVERLPNGDKFVGWGSQRWFTEFSPTGEVLFDGHLAKGNDNYRAFRYPWTGTPGRAAEGRRGATKAARSRRRVSWNGATGVASWELLAGAGRGVARAGRLERPRRASRPRSR